LSNWLDGIMKLGRVMADPSIVEQTRKDIFRDEFDNIIVDTVCAYDTQKWETGIQKDKGKWIIAEQYDTRDLAKIGHDEWVLKHKKDPMLEIRDADVWNIEDSFGEDEDSEEE